jgi:glycosyltransferase involved in cell wall biosynthesis
MVSAIIPTFDEIGTIGASVAAAKRHPQVGEVLVTEDGSHDGTGLRAPVLAYSGWCDVAY